MNGNNGYSLIIASYNEGAFLKQTIDNILKTVHYPFFEIIIVDDGSKDDSYLFLLEKAYKQKPLTLIRVSHRGIDAVRNIGVAQAKYDTFVFLDAHMLFSNGWLRSVNQLFIKYPSLSFLGLSCKNIFGKRIKKTHYFHVYTPLNITLEQNVFLNIKMIRQELIKVPIINGSNLIMKREVFESMGGFWEIEANWQDNFFSIVAYYLGIDAYIAPHITVYHQLKQSNDHVSTKERFHLDKSLLACFLLYPKEVFEDCLSNFKENVPRFLLSKTYKEFLKKKKHFIKLRNALKKYQKRTYTQFINEHYQYLPAFQLYDYVKGERLMFKNNRKAREYLQKAQNIKYLGTDKKTVRFKKNIKNLLMLVS